MDKFEAGQKWLTRGGEEVKIVRVCDDLSIMLSNRESLCPGGTYHYDKTHALDLVEMIEGEYETTEYRLSTQETAEQSVTVWMSKRQAIATMKHIIDDYMAAGVDDQVELTLHLKGMA